MPIRLLIPSWGRESAEARQPAAQIDTPSASAVPSSVVDLDPGARTPRDVIARINADTNAALIHAPVKSRFEELGATPKGSTPAELAAFLKSEIDKWGPVIRDGHEEPEPRKHVEAGQP